MGDSRSRRRSGGDPRRRGATAAAAPAETEPLDEGGVRLRPSEPPIDGPRVAYSYLVAVVAGLLGFGIAWPLASFLYGHHYVCATDEGFTCPFVSFAALALVLVGGLLALGAWLASLGGLWCLCTVALALLLFELVGDPTSPLLLLVVLAPLGGALASNPTSRGMSRRRWWITAAVAVAVILQVVIAGYLAVR